MTATRWRETKRLVQQALDRAPEERARFVAEATGDDPELGREVLALLGAAERSPAFLERPAAQRERLLTPVGEVDPNDPLPEQIGVFRVLRLLGSGGMGQVFLARRDEGAFEQRVAIKVVKRGMDTAAVLRRFHAEREILARLEHPFIARLIDGGSTEEGLPYFALEYVEGSAIDRHCERLHLDVESRLRLFLDVCEAVQYAHRHLVVHRDLKPANILVDADGRVRLLDFGIAKLLLDEPGSEAPTVLERPMTPEFASPEQARGEAVTTATDVYSLGVVLQLLLTGALPYAIDRRDPAEIARIVSDTAPVPASVAVTRSARPAADRKRLARRLAGDLDVILQRALAKDPARRYASVEALADDLRRHLDDRPISARPDSLAYRSRKFVQRHRAASALTLAALIAVVAGSGVALWQAHQARLERARAERRFADVRRLANTLLFEFYDAIDELPGSLPARELVLSRAQEYLASLAAEAGDDAQLLRELAEAYQRIGDVQGMPNWSSAGKTAEAQASFERALEIRERLRALADETSEEAIERAELLSHLGSVAAARGDLSSALARHREAVEITDRLWREQGLDRARAESVVHRVALGDDLWELGDVPAAADAYQAARLDAAARAESTLGDPPVATPTRRQLGVVEQRLGDAYTELARPADAIEPFRRSLAIDEELLARDPDSAELQRDLSTDAMRLAVAYQANQRTGEAFGELERARKLRQALYDADPRDVRIVVDLIESLRFLARAQVERGDQAAATRGAAQALALARNLAAGDPGNLRDQNVLAEALESNAEVAARVGDCRLARQDAQEAVDQRQALARQAPDNATNRSALEKLLEARRAGRLVANLDPGLCSTTSP
jgi:serine/threonine protein kinase